VTVIEHVSHRVVNASVSLYCPHWHYGCSGKLVPMLSQGHPNGYLVMKRYYRPCRGSSGRPCGAAISYSHPPPGPGQTGPPAGRSRCPDPAAVAFASLPCVRSSAAVAAPFLSPVAHARRRRNPAAGRWTLPAASQPSLTLRASRPPSKRSASFFVLVRFCWFACVMRCRFISASTIGHTQFFIQ
jgi:hypothetical protein